MHVQIATHLQSRLRLVSYTALGVAINSFYFWQLIIIILALEVQKDNLVYVKHFEFFLL